MTKKIKKEKKVPTTPLYITETKVLGSEEDLDFIESALEEGAITDDELRDLIL